MMDIFHRSEEVLDVCEMISPLAIQMAVHASMGVRVPFAMMHLHKGC